METFRDKRSKITSIADRSSGERFFSAERARREGNRQVQKQRNFQKLASDSSSCSSGTTDEDSFTFELGRRSSKQAVGTPMKKLLAEEMTKETESKRRSPSVIAKLMGLDGLPPQQPVHKQQKRSSENYAQRTTSVENAQRSGAFYDRRSSRKSSKEHQEFKDVFEVMETPKMESSSCSSRGTTKSKLTNAEMAFIRQKFMDAKRLSTDQKLQDSKEFHDALEVLDSNKDLLLKFLQQPDSLFTKHLHDLQGSPTQTHCGRIAAMKLSDAQKYENGDIGKSARRTQCKNYSKSSQKHQNGISLNSSEIQFEGKNESAIQPTRIVVLKPNLGKAQNGTKSVSSPSSSHAFLSDCRKHTEFPSIKNREGDLRGKSFFPDEVGLSRHKSRESREIAREITRQMRDSFCSNSMNFASAGFRGYAGDESSCEMSGNESEAITVTSRNSFELNNRYKSLSSRSTESSVSREAKKRLSERWKMTHKSQELGVVSRGGTLAEMLAIPDKELRPANYAMIGEDRISDKFARDDGSVEWVEPLGISSREGWKDGCVRKLSRSRSLPASSTAFGSPKTSMPHETFCDDRFLIPNEASKKERSKRVKGNSDWREGSLPRNSKSSSKKSHSSSCRIRESNETSAEIDTSKNQIKTSLEENDPSEKDLMIFETLDNNIINTSLVPENVVDVGHHNTTLLSEPPDELLSDLSAHMVVRGGICAGGQNILIPEEPSVGQSEDCSVPLHHPPPGLESPVSSKEADQPSPVSVLEAPFTDDLSSCSECFESLSADIHGLRRQLELLKSESEAYEEGPMLISSDEDVGEGSNEFSGEKGISRAEDCWEPSYLFDVLSASGFNNADPDDFMATWHTPECPVDPLVFEEVEKRYFGQTCSPRSERRLLFDRINSGLMEMYQQFMDPRTWVRPAIRIGSKWIKDGIQDGLYMVLASQEKKASSKDTLGEVLARESDWLDLGEDVDVLGREIERLLIDDLVAEVVVAM